MLLNMTRFQTFMTYWYSIVYTYIHIFFFHSYISSHLGWYHILVFINSAAMNTMVHLSFLFTVFAFFRSRFSGLYDSIVLFFSFWGNSILIAIMAVPINIPTNSTQWFLFSPCPHHSCYFLSFWWQPFWQGWVVSHCGFHLNFLENWLVMWASFCVSVVQLYVSWKNVYSGLSPVFNWIVCLIDFELYKCLK